MESPDKGRSYAKRDVDGSDGRRDMIGDDDDLEGNGKKKHKSSKSKKSSNGEDTDGWDGSGRRRISGERNENRRLSGGSSRGDADEGDYDSKKESSSKQGKKKQEVSALEKLSNWYQDGELESRHDSGDKSGNRSHAKSDDNERNAVRKTISKLSDHEASYRRSKNKDEKTHEGEDEKALDKDSYHLERREGMREDVKSRRRWDESDAITKTDSSSHMGKHDPKSGIGSDTKLESSRERDSSSRIDSGERKDRLFESASDKGESYSREERRIDSDRSKSRSKSDAAEDDYKSSPVDREDGAGRDKSEKHREQRAGRDAADNREKLSNAEDDGSPWMRDKTSKEVGHSRRSRTPERSGRHRHESENTEIEYERSSSLKRKESEIRDDRGKSREGSWSDRSREIWKRRPQGAGDRDVDSVHDRDREREIPRRGRDRMENERPVGRIGNRKDGRSEAVKASSNFGISTENYDVIEIQPKPLDYGRDESGSAFTRRTEAVSLQTANDEWGGRSQDDPSRLDGNETQSTGDDSSGKYLEGQERRSQQQGAFRGSLASHSSNQDPNVFGRMGTQSVKGNRIGRGGRGRPPPGRDNQQVNIPVPLMGSPFGHHLGMPPAAAAGPMQPLNPGGMPPAPAPAPVPVPVPPHGVFVSPFSPPLVWPGGGRGVDLSMLPGQRFPPTPNPALFFNQPGHGRGMPSAPGLNAIVPAVRPNSNDKGWVPPKSGGPPGKAPSRGEQNDYSQNFVDTGMRPQNFIRELELTNVEDYPKLRELIQKKDEIVAKASTPPMYYKSDLREFVLSPEFFGTKFDVILVDPPWEEYVHRAPGVTDHMEYWTFEEIINLKIEAIADTPSFIFLWVGDGVGLEQGRQCLKKWGFRRCEDICWVKTNKHTATPALRHDSHTLFQHSKEHCLMGIKGTVRRSTDGHIIHANIDTDVIIAEEPPYGSTAKPEEMYRIIEHFALGRRRIELFGEDHNIRTGWLTVGKELSSSNFNAEAYVRNFADKDGKVWQGGGGRNPPPDAPHLVQTTPEIESLRPKSPMKNQQQMQQQQSNSISLTTANSSSRRPAGNSPQNPNAFSLNQEASSSNHPAPWAPPMEGFKGPNDGVFDMYGYNMHPMPPNADYLDFESQRMMNMF